MDEVIKSTDEVTRNADGIWTRVYGVFGGGEVRHTERPVVGIDEVFALLEYASRSGIAKEKMEALSREVHSDAHDLSTIGALYSDLTAETSPINGRTLIDSREETIRRLIGIGTATILLFLLAAGNEVAGRWIGDMVEPEEAPLWLNLKRYAWDYLTPFFWGGLGACVFLLKRIQDLAAAQVYEHTKLQGWFTRILLGGILGAIVVSLVNPAGFASRTLTLTSNGLAFLTGVGVKVVYGAIERLIQNISDRFQLGTVGLPDTLIKKATLPAEVASQLPEAGTEEDREGDKTAASVAPVTGH